MKNKTIEILVGIPCSGKSSYVNKIKNNYICVSISRDSIRKTFNLNQYTNESEKEVTRLFNDMLDRYSKSILRSKIILDNTHCSTKWLNSQIQDIQNKYPDWKIKVKFFEVPLWIAYYRNIKRYLITDKWVPFKVIKRMYNNLQKIDKEQYKKYV